MLRYQGDKNILNIIPNSRKFKVNVDGPQLIDLLSSLLLTAMFNSHAAALEMLSEVTSWTWTQRECSYRLDHLMKMKDYTLLCFCSKDPKELKLNKVFWFFNPFYPFACSVNIFWQALNSSFRALHLCMILSHKPTMNSSHLQSEGWQEGTTVQTRKWSISYFTEATWKCYKRIPFLSSSLNYCSVSTNYESSPAEFSHILLHYT